MRFLDTSREGGELVPGSEAILFAHPKNLPALPPSCCFLLDRQDAMSGQGKLTDG
jgi:hypothetical protein